MDDKVKTLRKVDAKPVDPEQAALIELMRQLYDASRSGELKSIHGLAVFVEDAQVDIVHMDCGITVLPQSELIVELEDMAQEMREERKGLIYGDEDEEDG